MKRLILCLILGAIVAASLGMADNFHAKFFEANQASAKTGKPLVVIVHSDYCHWCDKLIGETKDLKPSTYNLATLHNTSPIASKVILPGRGFPQVHRWVKRNGKWEHSTHIGYMPPEQFEDFATGG
jgi:hypothetical protein